MDYESLLLLAKKNSDGKVEAKRALPDIPLSRSADHLKRKDLEKKKSLDANVTRYLAKRQEEERRRKNEANQKKEELLALRNQDAKARKRVKIMNKSAKSADKSAIQDAVGPSDYYIIEEPLCFMSRESLAQEEHFLKKMYNGSQEDKFPKAKINTNRDLNSTKNRVKQALLLGDVPDKPERHRERKKEGHSSQISHTNSKSDDEEPTKRMPSKPRPPPMNYMELLKLAEKLQQEPVKEAPKKEGSPMRPMTKKEREEFLLEEASRKRKEAGWKKEAYLKKTGKLPPAKEVEPNSSISCMEKQHSVLENVDRSSSIIPRIPKLSNSSSIPAERKITSHRDGSPSSKLMSKQAPDSPSTKQKTGSEYCSGSKRVVSVAKDRQERVPTGNINRSTSNHTMSKKAPTEVSSKRNDKYYSSKLNNEKQDVTSRHQVPRSSNTALSPRTSDQRSLPKVHQKPSTSSENSHQKRNTTSEKISSSNENKIKSSTQLQSTDRKFGQNSSSGSKPASLSGKQPPVNARQNASSVNRQASNERPRQGTSSGPLVNRSQPTADAKSSRPVSARPEQSLQKSAKSQNAVDSKSKQVSQSVRPKQFPPGDVRPKQFPPGDVRPKQFPPGDVRPKQFPPGDVRPKQFLPGDVRSKQFPPGDVRPKQFPPGDVRPKQFPPGDVRPKQFPPGDVRPKQFPPADVRPRQFPPSDVRDRGRLKANMKRRIIESDDDYDSEDAAFIDDGPDQGAEDYSKYIKEIFGYDKNRYRDIDDSDDRRMESSFQQQLKEEFTSTKLGILEDLEDIQKEKRREAMIKKRKKMK